MFGQMRVGALQFVLTPAGTIGGIAPAVANIRCYVGFAFRDVDDALPRHGRQASVTTLRAEIASKNLGSR